MTIAAGLLAALMSACGAASNSSGETKPSVVEVVTVAAAADLRYALDEIIGLITRDSPNVEVRVTYGSSGQFLQQIQSGAPFDVYLSADLAYPQQLVASGSAKEAGLFSYAIGRLALWVPDGSQMDPSLGLEILRDPKVQRIAIANPEHAPYGRAAVQALVTAGVLADVEERFVLGENVAQAAEFVASGNADAGIVAISLVLSDPLRGIGTWWEIPETDFARIDQGGLVLTDTPGAWTVRDALVSPAGREILERYGFRRPQGV